MASSPDTSPAPALSGDCGRGIRAVLVDDTVEIRVLVRFALQRVGIVVVGEAADGKAGVEVVAEQRPDVVVLDISMPVMDGLEALPLMRAAHPAVRIVMLSGFQASMVGDAALERGADAFVEKGRLPELVSTILRVCQGQVLPGSSRTLP